MHDIHHFATHFRNAIETALDEGAIDGYKYFRRFPNGCCGEASNLLAQFLLDNGISTRYVCGTFYDEFSDDKTPHAWLIADDMIIIDITGDQFKYDASLKNDRPVFVEQADDFYELFEVDERRDVCEFRGLQFLGDDSLRMLRLYETICSYL